MRPPEQLEELRRICPDAKDIAESGVTFVLLPGLVVPGQGSLDGLLCPQQRDGYPTRLLLSRQILGKGNNWTLHRILDRTWHAWSWTGAGADLRPVWNWNTCRSPFLNGFQSQQSCAGILRSVCALFVGLPLLFVVLGVIR